MCGGYDTMLNSNDGDIHIYMAKYRATQCALLGKTQAHHAQEYLESKIYVNVYLSLYPIY